MKLLGGGIAFLLIMLAIAAWLASPPRFEEARKAVKNPVRAALAGKRCDVHHDETGVAHTRGSDELTAFACFGYLHGRERTWQLDYLRRVAQGRVAETLGTGAVRNDFFMRLLGLADRAAVLFKEMPARDQELLWAYAEGLNRGISAALKSGVYELAALGYEPEPWLPEHSVAILLLQSFSETQATLWQDMKEEKRREALGPKAEALYRRDGLPWDTAILKAGEYARRSAAQSAPRREPGRNVRDGQPPMAPPPTHGAGAGSNSWILSPKLANSKRAWLANDPHLELLHPPFWHWVHVSGGDLDVIGASLPGVPVIPSGLNRHAAWGLTNSYIDAGEIVAVPIEEKHTFVPRRPTIWIKLGFLRVPYFFKRFERTKEGWPVLPLDAPPGRALVMRWTGMLLKGPGLSGFHRMMLSRSAKELDAFFSSLELPSWNFAYADTRGDIGFNSVGLLARHETAPWYGVRDGGTRELDTWQLMLPEERPRLFNPERGFIATANNRQLPPDARLHLGRSHPHGFRAFRIEELLRQGKHDLASQRAIQCDTQAVGARFLLPKLLALVAKRPAKAPGWGPREDDAIRALSGWDFSTGPGCQACAIHERWLDRIQEATALDIGALYRALDDPAPFVDAILAALPKALGDLGIEAGRALPTWADLHRAFFPHLSKHDRFASTGSVATPGSPYSVNVAGQAWIDGRYHQTSGASHRLIVELTSPPTAWFVLAGPNRDMEAKKLEAPDSRWLQWRDCRYDKLRFPFDWNQVKAEGIEL